MTTIELPNGLIEGLWDSYVRDKMLYHILSADPNGIGFRFAFDFGDTWKTWPFYRPEWLIEHGIAEPAAKDNLLAVFDANPEDKVGITMLIAKLMTRFGPPALAIVYSDAFIRRITADEQVEGTTLTETEHGALVDDFTTNPDTKVQEALLISAHCYDGRTWGRTMAYRYDDGNIVFDEQIDDDIENSSGPLTSLLNATVKLHGSNNPREVLLAIADGDEDIVDEMLSAYRRAFDDN